MGAEQGEGRFHKFDRIQACLAGQAIMDVFTRRYSTIACIGYSLEDANSNYNVDVRKVSSFVHIDHVNVLHPIRIVRCLVYLFSESPQDARGEVIGDVGERPE